MEIKTLERLAIIGACREEIQLSAETLASVRGNGHKTAERELRLLEDQGYIIRRGIAPERS